MANVLILGSGLCGLAGAMMLARDGHDVTVIEKDASDVPVSVEAALTAWERPGVAQFKQVHYMHARFRHVLDTELPDVRDALAAAGGRVYDPLAELFPPTIEDRAPRDGDDMYRTITGRRPMLETIFAQKAENETNVKILRGTKVESLLLGPEAAPGVPHVVGVKTSDGAEIRADIVIDAMGRRSSLPQWLADIGGRPPYEELEDSGYTYYSRYFRGDLPQQIGPPVVEFGSYSTLTLPADNDTWWVLLWMASGDQPLKGLRHEDKWTKVVQSIPTKAHWLEGEPIGGVDTMTGIMDRYRSYVVDGAPVVTGILPLGDAWACTNPSLGRGVSLGLWHAQKLRELMSTANGDPVATALRWHATTEEHITPWYRTQVAMDRARVRNMEADREGRDVPPPAADDVLAQMTQAFFTALPHDADIFRGFLEIMACLATPDEIFGRPGMFEKVISVAGAHEPMQMPGPSRQELIEILA